MGAQFQHHRSEEWIAAHMTLFADDFHFRWRLDSAKHCRQVIDDLRLIFEVLRERGLTINPEKSSFLVEVRGSEGGKWLRKHRQRDAEGNWQFVWDLHKRLQVPVVRSFRYLGVILSYHAFQDETMRFRLQQAQQHRNRLARILQGRGGLRLEQRRRVWKICVQTSQLYGLCAVGVTEAGYHLLRIQTVKHIRAFAKSPRHLTAPCWHAWTFARPSNLFISMWRVLSICNRLVQAPTHALPCYDAAGLLGWFRGISADIQSLLTKLEDASVASVPVVPSDAVVTPAPPVLASATTESVHLVSMPSVALPATLAVSVASNSRHCIRLRRMRVVHARSLHLRELWRTLSPFP